MDAFAVPTGPPPRPLVPQRLRGLAVALTVAFCVVAATTLGLGLLMFFRAWLVRKNIDERSLSATTAERVDTAVAVLGIAEVCFVIATGVVFVVWQYRHGRNAQVLGHWAGLGPEWAIAGWFVPLANFVLPGLQLFGSSRAAGPAAGAEPSRPRRGAAIVPVWAVTTAVGAVLAAAALIPTDATGDRLARKIIASDQIGGAGQLVLGVAAVLALVMVRTLTTRQERALAAAGHQVVMPAWGTPPAGVPLVPPAGVGGAPAGGVDGPPPPPPTAAPPTAAPLRRQPEGQAAARDRNAGSTSAPIRSIVVTGSTLATWIAT